MIINDVGGSASARELLTLCALKVDGKHLDWSLIAREALRPDGVERMHHAQIVETSPAASEARNRLPAMLRDRAAADSRVHEELRLAANVGAKLMTVLDDDYPTNLRLIPNLPPFLFVRGELRPDDARAVAVVGTRQASAEGLARAQSLSRQLAEQRVTVVSGLAAGIDTAAHQAALDAAGRTIAVMGTGITRCYPAENKPLAEKIVSERSAIVSQFWPSTPPAKFTFPRRNVVTSGISQGTAVIEASSTSGAKMQARLALEHGKQVFLLRSLVTNQLWAQKYLRDRGAKEVTETGDILKWIADPGRLRRVTETRSEQLSLL